MGGGGAKVKPDHGGYLAMFELHKTDNLIRLSLYELIRVLLREYMSVFTIFPILYCPKTQCRFTSRCRKIKRMGNYMENAI